MNENPFEQSTLSSSSSLQSTPPSSEDVEVRYPPAQRILVPAIMASSGVLVPLVLFFALPAPLNFLMAIITALMEFAAAALLWLVFNSSFVRADAKGISKSQFGKIQSARWDEIAIWETQQLGNGARKIIFKNAEGKEVMNASDLSNRKDGANLLKYIESKLQTK